MKLFVGLGNPGRAYQSTRHNIGFMFVDEVVKAFKGTWKLEKKLKGIVAFVEIDGERHLFLKPATYMNLSGESVVATMNFHKVKFEDVVVVYDDLDLPPATVKIRAKGTSGGHKGMASIIRLVGISDIHRIRIGIGRSEYADAADHVLAKFTRDEIVLIQKTLETAPGIIRDYLQEGIESAMAKHNKKAKKTS